MDAFSVGRYKMVVMVCGSQMGKTEVLFNVLGHRFVDGPYVPALLIAPTEKMVRSMSKDRFSKMVNSTPALKARLETGQRDNLLEKYFAGVRLGFGWAGSATELAGHPAGLVLVDEVDRMVTDVGSEGDPVSLAAARTKNYAGSKIGVCSTPTVEGASAIESHYQSGTMGRWEWPCPHCNEYFIPQFDLLTWTKAGDHSTVEDALTAGLTCPHCGALIENKYKQGMNAQGRYHFHTKQGDEIVSFGLEPPLNSTASFWVSGLCSPWVTWPEMAAKWIAANNSGENARRQTVINTEFGEWWALDGDRPEASEVQRLIEDYEPLSVPAAVQLITMGVDVQRNGLYYTIWGWSYNSGSHLLDYGFIGGDTAYDDVWLRLTRIREAPIDGQRIQSTFIDSGFRPGDTAVVSDHMVYKYCRQFAGQAYPVKGRDTMDAPYKVTKIDVTLSGRLIRQGLRLYSVNTHYFKEFIYSRIRFPEAAEGQPGGMQLHRETGPEFCRQLVSEELVIKPSGRFVWVRKHDNHYLDCTVYAACAAASMGVGQLRDISQDTEKAKPETSQSKSSFVGNHSNWLSGIDR